MINHMQDNRKGNALVIVGIVVVAVAVILFFVWKPNLNLPVGSNGVPMGSPAFAQQGTVVQGFPQNLVLNSPGAVQSSYSIGYSTSTNQYTAQWTSSESVDQLFNDYQAFLASSTWFIANQTSQPGFDTLYLKNGSSSANVSIFTKNGVTQLLVSYLH
jgi:hypothetical protein